MDSKDLFALAHKLLYRIYNDKEYSNILINSLNEQEKKALPLVFGVLERHFELFYTVKALCKKMPKKNEKIIIFMGIYAIKYLNKPHYAVINECVEYAKKIGKGGNSGFINAVLVKASEGKYILPDSGKEGEEIKYNLPYWVISLIKKQEPERYDEILRIYPYEKTEVHVRTVGGVTLEGRRTLTGYVVTPDRALEEMISQGKATYMSYPSSLVAYSVRLEAKDKKVLDMCAAPGGKSIQLAEYGGVVTSCDIHTHRVQLIEAYARKMKQRVNTLVADGTVYREAFAEQFDIVLVDAPCSGFGSTSRRKDIIINKEYDDVIELTKLQKKLLSVASIYVKKGGVLLYSTCTILDMENKDITTNFLAEHQEFRKEKLDLPYDNDGSLCIYPSAETREGFYICKMRKQ